MWRMKGKPYTLRRAECSAAPTYNNITILNILFKTYLEDISKLLKKFYNIKINKIKNFLIY